jgi:ferredoxin
MMSTSFLESLDARSDAIVDACTRCGACVAVCPTPALTGNDADDPAAVAAGVIAILQAGDGPEPARRWAGECCGTGHCLAACEHGINPRFMLLMARRALAQGRAREQRRAAGKAAFQSMGRGVRVLSRLQLDPALLEKLNPSSHPERDAPPDLVFYTGCNMLKTPHIGLLCLDVLDRLGVSYEVHGGPSACCGILQMRPGDTDNAGRQGYRTIERFAATGTSQVLAWCPTCQIQFGETLLPGYRETRGPAFDMTMFPVWLAQRLAALQPMMSTEVRERVAIYEFPGAPGVQDAVRALLRAVPGLELVDLGIAGVGYHLTSLASVPGYRDRALAELLRRAEAAGITTLAGIFHSDHRELVGHEPEWPFRIVNYMELVGASLGVSREDTFKRLRLMRDVDAILAACSEQIEANGLDPDEAREVILADVLAGQLLPVERARHPAC